MAANMCLSFVVLDLAWFSLWATVPFVLVAALIIGAYRGYARLTLKFASLQRLYDFSRALGTASLEPPSMSVDVLRQVCTVMRARRAELVLVESSGIARRISLDERGALDSNRSASMSSPSLPWPSPREPLRSTTSWVERQARHRPGLGYVPPCSRCPDHERPIGHRCNSGFRSRGGTGQLRQRRSAALRDSGRACQRQPRARPSRRGTSIRGRQQITSGHPRRPDRTPEPGALPCPCGAVQSTKAKASRLCCSTSTASKMSTTRLGHAIGDRLLVRGVRAPGARRFRTRHRCAPRWRRVRTGHCRTLPRLRKPSPSSTTCTARCHDRFGWTGWHSPYRPAPVLRSLPTTVTTWHCSSSGPTSPCTSPRNAGARWSCTRWTRIRACGGGS